jgi:ribosomal protein S18 acetylase RimI-like enzyme
MTDTHFYLATQEDIPYLHDLVNSAYRGESSRKGWTTEADFLDGIRVDSEGLLEMIQNKNAAILIVNWKGRPAGCVYLLQQDKKAYLGMLTVDPQLQAKGLGKMLLIESEEWARKKNCNKIEMTVITLREELIKWYERNGYSRTGETKPFPDDPRFGIPKVPLEFMVLEKKIHD